MKRLCIYLIVFFASVLLAPPAFADDLNVSIGASECCGIFFEVQILGGPSFGRADFNEIGYNWSFTFSTGSAVEWSYDPYREVYSATYGEGGSFSISGPDNLTFSGVVTGGSAYTYPSYASLNVTYSGQWSNGLDAYGGAEFFRNPYPPFVGFSSQVAPEPSSLALLVSGGFYCVGILLRACRRAGRTTR